MIKILQSIKKEYEGKKEQEIYDLQVYLTNSVGVGEHSDISKEIKNKIQNIEKLDAQIDTIDKYFPKETAK
jgi:hypothetical protein|tara:strand:+ start:1276 stop:1488 length:213 start_codon:yes stop_codon:yes gene_type:complete